jgi:hypothetical protein
VQYCNPAEHIMQKIYASPENRNKYSTGELVKLYSSSAECARQTAILEVGLLGQGVVADGQQQVEKQAQVRYHGHRNQKLYVDVAIRFID